MKTKKKKQIKKQLFTISLFIIFVLSFIDVNAQPKEVIPINYDFNNNVLLDKDSSYDSTMYNVRNQSHYTTEYLATETFEYDNISQLFDWNIDIPIGCVGDLFFDTDVNNKALRLIQNNSTNSIILKYFILETTELIVELFIKKSHGDTTAIIISEKGGTTDCIYLIFDTSFQTKYYDGVDWHILGDYYSNVWNHLKFTIDVNTDWSVDINGIEYDTLSFRGTPSYISEFKVICYTEVQYNIIYFDNFDLSKSYGYFNNRILNPQKEYTNQLEIDKFEFDYQKGFFEIDYYNWIQNEYDTETNDVKIISGQDYDINKYIDIWTPVQASTYDNGVECNENITSNIIDIVFNFEINIVDNWCATLFEIYPQNIDYNYPIKVKFNGQDEKIDIYNIHTHTYDEISSFSVDVIYTLNVYLNYYYKIIIYTLTSVNQNFKVMYGLDDADHWNNMIGLEKIDIHNDMSSSGTIAELFVNSVGIYDNGTSYQPIFDNGKFSLMIYEMSDNWNSEYHNFITINSINDYSLYVFSDYAKFTSGIKLRERSIQLEVELINFQDDSFDYSTPFLVFQTFDNLSIPYQVEIKGISLIRDDIESFGSYIYDNCNSDNNYFYVIDNELHYNFNNSLDSGIETMVIEFDVIDVLLDDEAIFTYTSYISSFYEGYVILETYGYFELFNISNDIAPIIKSYNLTDTEKFTLTEIRIYLRTDTLDNATGITKGFVRNLNIWLDVPLYQDYDPIGILELDFLEAMIHVVVRLIIFMIPSLVFRYKFGNKSVIPMWFLMAIVLVISGFIPFWLFFVNILAIGLMLITKKEGM